MKKRFLHTCKNPLCNKEFAVLYDKSGKFNISTMFHCPHCKKLQKLEMPVRKGRNKKVVKKKR